MPTVSDAGEAWLEEQAEHLVDVKEVALADSDAVAARYMELLAIPEERNEAIAAGIVGYLYLKSVEELGDADLAASYWAAVDPMLDLSWEELHSVPPVKRGDIWNQARRIIDLLCIRQARVETGFVSNVMQTSVEFEGKSERRWNKLTDSDRAAVAAASGLKERADQKSKERAGAV